MPLKLNNPMNRNRGYFKISCQSQGYYYKLPFTKVL